MEQRNKLGAGLALFGALLGIVGTFVIFINWYDVAKTAQSAEPGCEILLKYIMPALSDVGLLGGVLYAVSAYGFLRAEKWAFPMVVIANVLALQGGWFINVPFMAAGMPPVYFIIFWPNLILYFLLMWAVGRVPWSRTLIGLLSGMAFVFCFMNGVASLSRMLTIGTPLFAQVQRLHWFASIAWGVVTVGLLVRPRDWMRVVGLTAGLVELVVGIPLVIATTRLLGRFSLFSFAPISSLALVIIFLLPWGVRFFSGAGGDDTSSTMSVASGSGASASAPVLG